MNVGDRVTAYVFWRERIYGVPGVIAYVYYRTYTVRLLENAICPGWYAGDTYRTTARYLKRDNP